MDFEAFKYFLELSDLLHYKRSSEALHITPSALTRAIQKLENDLGVRLFERHNRKVALTSEGKQFRRYAQMAVDQLEQLKLKWNQDTLQGEIRLYCSVTASYTVLPDIVRRFCGTFPNIRIDLVTGDVEDAVDRIAEGDVDVAVASFSDKLSPRLVKKSLLSIPLVAVAPLDLDCTKQHKFYSHPLIMPAKGIVRERLEERLEMAEGEADIYGYVSGFEAILSLVSAGCGVSVVPKMVLDKSTLVDQVQVVNLSPGFPDLDIGICARKQRLDSPSVLSFWQTCSVGTLF